jgi:two-component system, NarL family, sensor histidine kinase UhpB
MDAPLRILLLEDVTADARLIELELRRSGLNFLAHHVETRDEFVQALSTDCPDVILADYSLPSFDGLAALEIVLDSAQQVPFIFVSGAIGEERAITALKSGATDYVLKDRLSRLPQAVERALAEVAERERRKRAEEAVRKAHAELEQRVAERTADLATANAELQRAHEQLQQAAQELEIRVQQRTAELSESADRLSQTNAALQANRHELQMLSHRLVEVQEDERVAIARELHDEAGQALTSIMVGLHLLEQDLADHPEAARVRIVELKKMAESVMGGLHQLAVNLRPASLDKLGLVPALRQFLEQFARQNNVEVISDLSQMEGTRLPPEVETALFRIVQEALINIARHARATSAGVILTRRNGVVTAIIEDNGVGFDPDKATHTGRLGLLGMRERAEMLGGNLTLESSPGTGTTIYAEVPWRPLAPVGR